jgi:predicted nucleic acid-binding protein
VTELPLLCDTGALLDYLVAASPDHEAFREAIDGARTRYIPGLVLSEVDYFLRHERGAMRALTADMARGAFTYVPPTLPLVLHAMEIDARHQSLELGLVDASIVSLAEELRVRRIATRDVRHFSAVTLRDGSPLELVVYPSEPDASGA